MPGALSDGMELELKQSFIDRWNAFFPRESLLITFEISSDLRGVQKARSTETWRCFVCDLTKVRNGTDLVFEYPHLRHTDEKIHSDDFVDMDESFLSYENLGEGIVDMNRICFLIFDISCHQVLKGSWKENDTKKRLN